MTSPTKSQAIKTLREDAWIGDAVLELLIRQWVLNQGRGVDAERKKQLTCNQFLSALGPPTEVEARVGILYQQQGLEAAKAFIEQELLPRHEQQERRRQVQQHKGRRS